MRRNILNTTKFLVYCAICNSTAESFILPEYLNTTNSNARDKTYENDVIIDTKTKFKWTATSDMVTKLPLERHLEGITDSMLYDEEFYLEDANDKKKPSSKSGGDSFWELYDKLDIGKNPPMYTTPGGGSKPVLSKFRYIYVPIWWKDEDTTDPDKKITRKAIKDMIDYIVQYYKRMSFGKFIFQNHIILPQTVIPVSSANPQVKDLDNAAFKIIEQAGYKAFVDYDGVVFLWNVAKSGPFDFNGGLANANDVLAKTYLGHGPGLSNFVTRHEFAHNFGHFHHYTNGYTWRFGNPERDGYDMVSGGNTFEISDLALASKWFFGWVPDWSIIDMQPQGSTSGCPKCVSEGTFKLYPFDGNDASKRMGIHIPITQQGNTLYSYWLSYRGNNGAEKGLSIHVSWFDNIGTGQFGATYDSLNYDAFGNTKTQQDSFVLPGTCYHISPSIKMLEIDPIASIATQPVVCVKKLSIAESITIDVSFVTATSPIEENVALKENIFLNELQRTQSIIKDEVVMECGTSISLDVKSNKNVLVHVDNTGKNGILTLTSASSSATASATAYIYDRYPTSPIVYSAPGGYGAFKSLNASNRGSSSLDYTAKHNEAWILIKAKSKTTFDASCTVNRCQLGQKKVGKKCKPCDGNDKTCEKCPAGLEFLASACVLSETIKQVTLSKRWRLWTPDYHTINGRVWDVNDIKFFSEPDCTGNIINGGTPIDSRNAGGDYGPESAFDSSEDSKWGGRSDNNEHLWIGMKFNKLKKVRCISILDGFKEMENGVSELRVQAWGSDTRTWHNVIIVKNYKSGQRNNVSLNKIPAPSPIAIPNSPTSAPVALPVAAPVAPPVPGGPVLSFQSKVKFGQNIKVSFNNPNKAMAGVYPWFGVYRNTQDLAMDSLPDEDLLIAYLHDCNTQEDCDYWGTQTGLVNFGATPISSHEDYGFPFRNGRYRICFMHDVYSSDEDYERELISPCKLLIVKRPKKKMIKKARIIAKDKLQLGDTFTANFQTPIAIQNQWIGLYSGRPRGDLGCKSLLWVYTGCNNQKGNQIEGVACANKLKRGSIQMDKSSLDTECGSNVWPLPVGTYYMCVSFYNYEPYTKFKCSNKIKVTA